VPPARLQRSAPVKGCSLGRLPRRVASVLTRLVFSCCVNARQRDSSALYKPPCASLATHSTSPLLLQTSKPPPRRPLAPLAAMDHQDRERAGVATNGFGRRADDRHLQPLLRPPHGGGPERPPVVIGQRRRLGRLLRPTARGLPRRIRRQRRPAVQLQYHWTA
jgi:hypothetical protein